jgi:hypothetical protein
MEPVENILKEYRNADAECRLDLFLAHRDLRDLFTTIETEEGTALRAEFDPNAPKSSGAFSGSLRCSPAPLPSPGTGSCRCR